MTITINTTSKDEIQAYLCKMNNSFIPPLDTTVNINEYAEKIFNNAERIEFRIENELMGLLAYYVNNQENTIFITTFSIHHSAQKKGYAQRLLDLLIQKCMNIKSINKIVLEVNDQNLLAKKFYIKNNFVYESAKNESSILARKIK